MINVEYQWNDSGRRKPKESEWTEELTVQPHHVSSDRC